jgi:hypothetical protein
MEAGMCLVYAATVMIAHAGLISGLDIFVKLQLGCHPLAVVQYTFTHKQYTERHKTNNT